LLDWLLYVILLVGFLGIERHWICIFLGLTTTPIVFEALIAAESHRIAFADNL